MSAPTSPASRPAAFRLATFARVSAWLALALASAATTRADQVTTFEGLLPANAFNQDAGASNQFAVDGNHLNNSYNASFNAWYGWALSSKTDATTPGFTNQYSSITGSGADGSQTYAVASTYGPADDAFSNPFRPADSIIDLAPGMRAGSIAVTNTTYTYLSMKDGDSFAGSPFVAGDFLRLDIEGYSGVGGQGTQTGDVSIYLGQGTSLLNTWKTLDLSSLGAAESLRFALSGSRNDSQFGLNTPAYVAIDDLSLVSAAPAVPEPASLALLACGLGLFGMLGGRRRRRVAAPAAALLLLVVAMPESRGRQL